MATYFETVQELYGQDVDRKVWDAYLKRVRRRYRADELREHIDEVLDDFGRISVRYKQIAFYLPGQTVGQIVAILAASFDNTEEEWRAYVKKLHSLMEQDTDGFKDLVTARYGEDFSPELWEAYYAESQKKCKLLTGDRMEGVLSNFGVAHTRASQLCVLMYDVPLEDIVHKVVSRIHYTDEQWSAVLPDILHGTEQFSRVVYVSVYSDYAGLRKPVYGDCVHLPVDYDYATDMPRFNKLKELLHLKLKASNLPKGTVKAFSPEYTTVMSCFPVKLLEEAQK